MKAIAQAEPKSMAERTDHQEFMVPVVNIFETQDGYALEAEMPGVTKDGLEITLEGNEITILGRRATEPVNGEALLRERSTADYRRVFELDPAIDTEQDLGEDGAGHADADPAEIRAGQTAQNCRRRLSGDFQGQIPRPFAVGSYFAASATGGMLRSIAAKVWKRYGG